MIVNVNPYARLLRSLSIPRLFALGATLVGVVAYFFFFVPVHHLRYLAVVFGLALGVGVTALLTAVARLFALGGRAGIAAGLAFGVIVLAGLFSVWYSLKVAQPNARGACYEAAHPSLFPDTAGPRAQGRELMTSAFFRLAHRLRPDPTIAEDCYHDDTDEVRMRHGLCPRVLKGNEVCFCGFYHYPRGLPCPHPKCELSLEGARLSCD